MKIEKVNENQIRCTLTKADLADRQLKLSELAYGTEKAKDLFRDMMQQAAYEFGFEAEDIPLMIEAIPLSSECIILIITKVEYPEELDTRFSKFAPSSYDESDTDYDDADDDGADSPDSDVLDLFRKLKDTSSASNSKEFVPLPDALNKAAAGNAKSADPDPAGIAIILTKLYTFKNLETVADAAGILKGFYTGTNPLYRDGRSDDYILMITKGNHTPEDYNKVCNILSEYSSSRKSSDSVLAYINEHCEVILKNNALQTMAELD